MPHSIISELYAPLGSGMKSLTINLYDGQADYLKARQGLLNDTELRIWLETRIRSEIDEARKRGQWPYTLVETTAAHPAA